MRGFQAYGRAVVWAMVLAVMADAAHGESPVGPAGAPAQSAPKPKPKKKKVASPKKRSATKAKAKAKAAVPVAEPAPEAAQPAPEFAPAAPTSTPEPSRHPVPVPAGPRIDPLIAAAGVTMQPALVAALAAQPALRPNVASGQPSVPTTGANGAVWDTHLPTSTPAVVAVSPRRVRVFGHLAINHWEGERNVNLRAGPRGTTNVWDAVVGVEGKLSDDVEMRIRALSILPAVSGDGDGAGPGAPTGANFFKDFIYMRDVYIAFLRLFGWKQLNARFGRVPLAFGDEYKQYDAPDNPLVSHSVPFFWGFDEGLQLYGELSPDISYTAQLYVDGELGNGADESTGKAYGVRVEGNHGTHWHWSLSAHDNATTGAVSRLPSLYFGRELAAPVGNTGAVGGASRSLTIDSRWMEADVRYNFKRGYLAAARGYGKVEDDGVHNRAFEWFKVEPLFQVTDRFDLVARYSGMNVKGETLGYRFNSFETGGTELNFDVNERQRISVGGRYRLNDATFLKLEYTHDEWTLIPTALIASRLANPEDRDYAVLQAAVRF
jgi:hypothetical protein